MSQIPKEQYDFINNAIDLSIKDLKGELELDWITKRTPIHTNELNVNKDEFSSFLKFIMANLYDKKDTYKAMKMLLWKIIILQRLQRMVTGFLMTSCHHLR